MAASMDDRPLPALDWAPRDDPWYRLGVWCVIYGGIVAAPTLSMAFLLGLFGVVGGMGLDGEFYWLAGVGGVAGAVVACGLLVIRRSRRATRRHREIDEPFWL